MVTERDPLPSAKIVTVLSDSSIVRRRTQEPDDPPMPNSGMSDPMLGSGQKRGMGSPRHLQKTVLRWTQVATGLRRGKWE